MTVRDARTLKFDPGRAVFFDTNIWLALFPATEISSYKKDWAISYSVLFERLIKFKVSIVINPMVMSEYINRFCRIEHEAYCMSMESVEYKDFRNGPDFSYVASAASEAAKEILSTPVIAIKGVDSDSSLDEAIESFKTGRIDFNDSLYVDTCVKNEWPIVTNDSDFGYTDKAIEVWTANDKLIKYARDRNMFKK